MDITTMHSHTTPTAHSTRADGQGSTPRRLHAFTARRGSTLSMALMLVMSAALLSVFTLQRGLEQWKSQATSSAEKLAFYMAESGLADAIDDIRSDGSGNIGTRELPALYGSGAFWVETVTDSFQAVHITSTGLYDGTAHRLTQVIAKPQLPIGAYGFFGSSSVSIGEDVLVESLDVEPEEDPGSGGGSGSSPVVRIALPVAPPLAQLGGLNLLGSDGGIELLGGSSVLGSLLAGPEAILDLAFSALVSGSMLPDDVVHGLPDIAMPMVASTGPLTIAQNAASTLGAATHEYGAILLNTRSKLTIVGPAAIYASSLIVKNGAVLALDTTAGAVHFYIENHLGLAAGSKVTNSSGDASKAVFLVNGRGDANQDSDPDLEAPIEWFTTQPFTGAVYAPYAAMTLPPDVTFQGSINALDLTVGDRDHMIFDPRVLDIDLRGRDYVFLSWRVVDIPADEKAKLRRDVVREAIARGDALPTASAARIAATSEFRFTTADGDEFTYRGTSLLDLTRTLVDTVLPVVAKVEAVPQFAAYETDTGRLRGTPEANFKAAYYTMLRYIGDSDWQNQLETGRIDPAVVTSIRTNGVLCEPFRSALSEASVRADLDAYLTSSWLPANSKRLLQDAIDLFP